MKCVLADIADVTMGQSPKSEYYNSEKNGMPFLQGNRTFGKKYPTFDTYTTFITKTAKSGDIIMSVRAPVGDVNITPIDMCLGRGVCGIRMKNENQEFLFYLLKYYMPRLVNKQSGTVFGSVNKNDINSLEIDIPEDSTIQRKIARYLSMIDEKIELNEKINKNLEQQAEAIFQSVLSNAITTVNLDEIADVKGGKRLPKGVNLIDKPNAHPYIRVRDLNNALFASLNPDYAYVDEETQKSISRYIVSTGDVLISIVGTIGLTAIVDSTLDKANLTENCVKITNLKHITPEYLLLYLRSQLGKEAIAKGTVGAVQQKLPIKNIQAIPIPLLSEKDKNALFCTLDSIFSGISNNVIQSTKLASLRDTLLPKLMSGELDVADINL